MFGTGAPAHDFVEGIVPRTSKPRITATQGSTLEMLLKAIARGIRDELHQILKVPPTIAHELLQQDRATVVMWRRALRGNSCEPVLDEILGMRRDLLSRIGLNVTEINSLLTTGDFQPEKSKT